MLVVISQHLLNVFVQLANTRGIKKKSVIRIRALNQQQRNSVFYEVERGHFSNPGRETSAVGTQYKRTGEGAVDWEDSVSV
jgi:hypothetical protein